MNHRLISNKYLDTNSDSFIAGAKQTRYASPVLSVKRSFRLKNTGLTPIWFAGFDVEGVPCEGYGFKVLNCEGFNLEPSGTKDIDIAFSPYENDMNKHIWDYKLLTSRKNLDSPGTLFFERCFF